MMCSFVLIAAMVGCTISAPISPQPDGFEKLTGLIPQEITDFFRSLTPEETKIWLSNDFQHVIGENTEEFLAVIRSKSVSLHDKAKKTIAFVQKLIDALPAKTKEFVIYIVKNVINNKDIRQPSESNFFKIMRPVIAKYDTLSAEEKTSLKKDFAIIDFFFGEKGLIRERMYITTA